MLALQDQRRLLDRHLHRQLLKTDRGSSEQLLGVRNEATATPGRQKKQESRLCQPESPLRNIILAQHPLETCDQILLFQTQTWLSEKLDCVDLGPRGLRQQVPIANGNANSALSKTSLAMIDARYAVQSLVSTTPFVKEQLRLEKQEHKLRRGLKRSLALLAKGHVRHLLHPLIHVGDVPLKTHCICRRVKCVAMTTHPKEPFDRKPYHQLQNCLPKQ
mmetsp:Transcript_17262/g.42085  ORF Transcript_17262/g.42085 Transcript_17262/m.42085 type:complete len:218 (+) Transcript_17262:3474-4127(+)